MPDRDQPQGEELDATHKLSKNEIKQMLERHGVAEGDIDTSESEGEAAADAEGSDT